MKQEVLIKIYKEMEKVGVMNFNCKWFANDWDVSIETILTLFWEKKENEWEIHEFYKKFLALIYWQNVENWILKNETKIEFKKFDLKKIRKEFYFEEEFDSVLWDDLESFIPIITLSEKKVK